MNAISEESDPTLEIRTLIEQLQQSARDSRGQVRAAEQERDTLAVSLARAEQQIEALRTNEQELRSRFVEITSLIQERDAALLEAERRSQSLAEAVRKNEATVRERNDAQRQRDEAVRLRDEATRKLESYNRSSEEHARLTAETQKQLLTIRQARDGAHAQVLELNTKLGATEDLLAEVEYQREAAQKAGKQAAAEAADFRRQLDIVTTDRDATAKQVEALTAELDTQRQKFLDLAEQKSAALAADGEHVAALAETRTQIGNLTTERDSVRNRNQELARELEELRAQFQTFREEAAQAASVALNAAHEKATALEVQAREQRHASNNLRQQVMTMGEQLAASQRASEETGIQMDEIRVQLQVLQIERDEALVSLTAAQKQIDHIIRDRDQIRQLATENTLEFESQIQALNGKVASLEQAGEEGADYKRELNAVNKRFEKQRLETIDIATQLQTAQREVKELSASLAEARLQVKFANAATRATRDGRTKSDFAPLLAEPTEEVAASAAEPAPESVMPSEEMAEEVAMAQRQSVVAMGIEEPLTEKEARGALGAMRHCFQSFTKTPTDLSLLNELHCHVEGFAERARVSGLIALYRLANSFSNLTRGLYETPEQVNPSTLRTVHQTIEFIASLMKERNLAQVKDPAKALIYAVDDDIGNCESIALTMEESMMRTTYALDPNIGLSELASSRYDLILLDVNLPGIDGFELCKQIRTLAIHEKTPIVFLTGLATLENRVQSSLSGGNDFIAKPFNLHELSVKVITLILKAQLQLV